MYGCLTGGCSDDDSEEDKRTAGMEAGQDDTGAGPGQDGGAALSPSAASAGGVAVVVELCIAAEYSKSASDISQGWAQLRVGDQNSNMSCSA